MEVHHVVTELSGSNKAVVAVPAYQWFGFDSRCLMSFLTIFFNLPSFYLQIRLVFLTRSINMLCETNRRLYSCNYTPLRNFYNLYQVCYSLLVHQHLFPEMLQCKNLLLSCILLDREFPHLYCTKGSNCLHYRQKLIRSSKVNNQQSHSLILFPK